MTETVSEYFSKVLIKNKFAVRYEVNSVVDNESNEDLMDRIEERYITMNPLRQEEQFKAYSTYYMNIEEFFMRLYHADEYPNELTNRLQAAYRNSSVHFFDPVLGMPVAAISREG